MQSSVNDLMVPFRSSFSLVLGDRTCEDSISLHFVKDGPSALVAHTFGDKSLALAVLEELSELLESDDKFGFIVMDGDGTLFGTFSGSIERFF